MKRDEVLAILEAHREQFQKLGVKSLSLFGSVARDEADADSDVDLLVEFDRQGGFFQLLQVQYYLEDILGCSVDLGTQDALREHLREPVLEELINAL
jgi:predicted nucleotidyltransferase